MMGERGARKQAASVQLNKMDNRVGRDAAKNARQVSFIVVLL